MRKITVTLATAAAAMVSTLTLAPAATAAPVDGAGAGASAVIHPIEVQGTAPSATVWDNCIHGQACVFQNSNGGGLLWVVPSAGSFKLSNYDMNNRISAVWNRSGGTMTLYDGSDFSNSLGQFGAYGPPINVPTGINDRASSLTLY
ncbi:peptidase inhibitor family I36 protein [Streptomyces sp. NBC_01565]|uniref:peptidase inhibitor family I36 protein n=1 Tax=Streptomyces sp. NBC_01565 TaxID=2975881 RepID=UPI00225B3FB7|nr:peptidase inhibitor family I36 protein [Streptomyces sp. NBC_01565]MCX4539426.1 peptidase inhibitor family I36 protein [Streptomyces sp. NBC_01565]